MNARIEKRITLKPIIDDRGSAEEMILLLDDGYPVALFHVDFVWDKFNHRIHEKLSMGETVIVDMKLIEVNL
jgi:hypothetical protein